MDPEILPVVLYLVFGCIYCFFGYAFLRFLLVVAGCAFGMGVGILAGNTWFSGNPMAVVILCLLGIAAGGALFAFLYEVAVFLIGFSAGVLLTPVLLSIFHIKNQGAAATLILVFMGLLAGMLALFVAKYFLIVFTSILGSFVSVVAIRMLWEKTTLISAKTLRHAYAEAVEESWWLILLLFLAGMGSQLASSMHRTTPAPEPKEKKG